MLKLAMLWVVRADHRGVTSRQRWLFAVCCCRQGGEFAFVVFGATRIAGLLEGVGRC
ncbi:MAG: hypothetical protein IPI73_13055 [Betaproteobacteria bacterium]|nr:hypothetical protein [Betaproteobacteria bacterium]